MTTTTIKRTRVTVEEFARRAAMAHARKLGAAASSGAPPGCG